MGGSPSGPSPTPNPTNKPTYQPTNSYKVYTAGANIRTIGKDGCWHDDLTYGSGSGGWEILDENNIISFPDEKINRIGADDVLIHYPFIGDEVKYETKRWTISQFFQCDQWSDIIVDHTVVGVNTDYNDYVSMYVDSSKIKTTRGTDLSYLWDVNYPHRYRERSNNGGRRDAYEPFLLWFDVRPTWDDDILGVYNVIVCCAAVPTAAPTDDPTPAPTDKPTRSPTDKPTRSPTPPTRAPTDMPTPAPTDPTTDPTTPPTVDPTTDPTKYPTYTDPPTVNPTNDPTKDPTTDPTRDPTTDPTKDPTTDPTVDPTMPTTDPTQDPTQPTGAPTDAPSFSPTDAPSFSPTDAPTGSPSQPPTAAPTDAPSFSPTSAPSFSPTGSPTHSIRIVPNGYWTDDYIYMEKYWLWNETEIGWLLHNAYTTPSDTSLMFDGIALENDLSGNATASKVATTTVIDGQTYHGAYWKDMRPLRDGIDADDEREHITLRRDFECASQSLVNIWYHVVYCKNGGAGFSNSFSHALLIDDPITPMDAAIVAIEQEFAEPGNASDVLTHPFLSCTNPIAAQSFAWQQNFTAYDDIAWYATLKFTLKHGSDWFMLTNFTILCDLKFPSAAPTSAPSSAPTFSPSAAPTRSPTSAPTGSPSQPPTAAPTFSPTNSPLTCPDYGYNYSNIDGADLVLDPSVFIEPVELGANYSNITVLDTTLIGSVFVCDNPHGCNINCVAGVSCLVSQIVCNNTVGCNINCVGALACGSASVWLDTALSDGASVSVVCSGENSCKNLEFNTFGLTRGHVHCIGGDSCDSARFYFDYATMQNESDTFVACYVYGACDEIAVFAAGPYTQLRLYEYSRQITLNNGFGYSAMAATVQCGLDTKWIKVTREDRMAGKEEADIAAFEYENNNLPCESSVTIYCNVDAAGRQDWDAGTNQCQLLYRFTTVDVDLNDPRYVGESCVYAWLPEITQFECREGGTASGNFTCSQDPTRAPTPAPTNVPTLSPTAAPTDAPSFSPSAAPTFSPSAAPTAAPSFSPSFSPTRAPSAAPTYSPTRAPSHAPTQPPTAAPSFSPTQAPTRIPTKGGDIYDMSLSITYKLEHLTKDNIQWIVNFNETRALSQLTEIIEMHYFDESVPYFEFVLNINKINGYALEEIGEPNSLIAREIVERASVVRAESLLEFNQEFENHFVLTSQSETWAAEVTQSVRALYNNSEAEFSVQNKTELEAILDDPDDPPQIAFYVLNAFLGLCVLAGIAAMLQNRYQYGSRRCSICIPVDSSNWFSIILYGLQIYDMYSDMNLTVEIFEAYANRECDINPVITPCALDQNLDGDDPEKWDTIQEWALLFAGWSSLAFMVIPYVLNLRYAARIASQPEIRNNVTARTWFEYYQYLFIVLVIFSGGCYPSLNLVSSRIFGLALFETGLSSFELSSLSDIRVMTTVMTENGPQLLVQIAYSLAISDLTNNTILAFTTSMMSIVASLLNYFINKDKEGQTHDVFYYWELKVKPPEDADADKDGDETEPKELETKPPQEAKLTKEERAHINLRKGIKLEIVKKILKLYPDIDKAHFEVGYVTLREDNFVIRVCQHIHEQDLTISIDEEAYESIADETKREEARLRPYKSHCYELYAANSGEVKKIIFSHFKELDRDRFTMGYHREYPKGNADDKLFKGDDKVRNLQALIGVEAGDVDTDGTRTRAKSTTKPALVVKHRDQFKEAFERLQAEVNQYRARNPYFKDVEINKQQYLQWMNVLQNAGYDHGVIDDTMKFALSTGLFKKDEGRESDIDDSTEERSQSHELFKPSAELAAKQYKEQKLRELSRLPAIPTWASKSEEDQEGEIQTRKQRKFWSKKDKKKKEKKNTKKGIDGEVATQIELHALKKDDQTEGGHGAKDTNDDDDETDETDENEAVLVEWANQF